MDSPPAVFVHGSGSAGAEAWPLQQADPRFDRSVFVIRPGFGENEEPVRTSWAEERGAVVTALGSSAHLVGWSYGALAALLAAAECPDRVRTLCLVEPAAFSLARGEPAVERHIRTVGAVMARRDELSATEFVAALMQAFGRELPPAPVTADDVRAAERMRLMAPPWEAPVSTAPLSDIPTLVITGTWNPEYEATSLALERAGARLAVLEGVGHRIQDHALFNDTLWEFWKEHARGES